MAESTALPVTADELGLSLGEEYAGQLDVDLGNLMACDASPQDARALREDTEARCLELATQITQSLVAALFQLPGRLVGLGRVVDLPAPSFTLPRQKPLPTVRPPTRWEKFAQQKGIQKRKRSVKVWDEEQQEWRRRFGYKRAGDDRDIPIVEAGPNDVVGEDPFTKMKQERAQKRKSTEKRQLANAKGALKSAGRSAVPATLKLAASLPEHGKGQPTKQKDLKNDIKLASRHAGVATASMGKFDARLEGERAGERRPAKKRQSFEPSHTDLASEKAKAASAVDRILRATADDVIDMERAVSNVRRKVQKEPAEERDPKRDLKRKKKGSRPALKPKGGKKGGRKGGQKGGVKSPGVVKKGKKGRK